MTNNSLSFPLIKNVFPQFICAKLFSIQPLVFDAARENRKIAKERIRKLKKHDK